MESVTGNSSPSTAGAVVATSKRLIFDRRYGWVLDEWKDPSEEALSGGRGMFCILPLSKRSLETALTASQSINVVASSALKVLEKPENLSPEVMIASLNHQVHKVVSSIKEPEFDLAQLTRNFKWKSASCSSPRPGNGNNSHNDAGI